MILKLIKEPMLQFLLAGAVLYIGYQFFNPTVAGNYGNKVIVVNDSTLKSLLNIRNKQMDDEFDVNTAFASLGVIEKQNLVNEYIEEEALYRMALEMGLDENDFIIRRRMVQKLSFLLEDLNISQIGFSEGELKTYYDEHADEFSTASKLSFTHVYLAEDKTGETSYSRARDLLVLLNSKPVVVGEALSHGDDFPLKQSYAHLTPNQTTAVFGRKFSDELFETDIDNRWQGPLQSGFGYHLVYIEDREAGHIAPFDSVRDEVALAWQYREKQRLNRLARQSIIENYQVVRKYD
jgi:PPIC-type PPIASE domain